MRQRNRAHKKAKQKNIPDYWKKYRDIRNEVKMNIYLNFKIHWLIRQPILVNGEELLNQFVNSKIELLQLAQLM